MSFGAGSDDQPARLISDQSPLAWEAWLQSSLAGLRQSNLERVLRPTLPYNSSSRALILPEDLQAWIAGRQPSSSQIASYQQAPVNHQSLLLFSLNDYLGLASHPDVCQAASSAVLQYGMGPRSSALVGGYTSAHRDLELGLAWLKGAEDCLLFPTGFAANLAVMSALGSAEDVAIYSDELNHASIIDGARLASRSGGRLHVYRHNDLAHLGQLLAAASPRQRHLVVTDSLFSMDGDFADLRGLAALKRRHNFLLAVDEAHATLVCGERGGGAAEALGVADQVDLHIGTLSKAFGALGGFVACSRSMKSLLLNRSRPFIYSTALPLPVVAAAQAALAVSYRESWRRSHVWQLVSRLGDALGVPALSPVVPLVIGGEVDTMAASAALLMAGLHVPTIRPPTVAPGTCRLRVSLCAAHTLADVDMLVAALTSETCSFAGGLQQLPHLVTPGATAVRDLHLHQPHTWNTPGSSGTGDNALQDAAGACQQSSSTLRQGLARDDMHSGAIASRL